MSVLKGQAWDTADLPSLDTGDVSAISLDLEGKVFTVGPTGASATEVQGTTEDGYAKVGNSVVIAGVDGSGDVRTVLTNTDGEISIRGYDSVDNAITIQGATVDGAALVGDPVPIAGVDGSGNVQSILTNTDGEVSIRGYDNTITSIRTFETAPVNASYLVEELVDATDQSISNYYYSVSMDDYKDVSFEFELSADATLTIEASNDVAFTTPKDITLVANELVTGTSGVASFVNSNGILDFSNLNITYVRAKLAITSATNTAFIVSRKKAL